MIDAQVTRILLAECRLPLPRPIRLGQVAITTRDYVAVRLETKSGLHGDAFGYPRGTPLFDIARMIAGEIAGAAASDRASVIDGVLSRRVNTRSTFIRAASLFEIALCDLHAKSLGRTWADLNGATRTQVPMMAVAGYYLDDRTISDVADEVSRLLDAGYARVKIMLRGDDLDFDRRYVTACSKVAGDRLAVDAHWSFHSLGAARDYLSALDGYGLAFIEDPFGPHLNGQLANLQPGLVTPLAAGEDMPDENSLADLSNHIPVMRIDATTCGGLDKALAVAGIAAERGRRILPHTFAPLHAQLAAASPAVEMVELIPADVGADPFERLLSRDLNIRDGVLSIDPTPGAGIQLDWQAVSNLAASTYEIGTIPLKASDHDGHQSH